MYVHKTKYIFIFSQGKDWYVFRNKVNAIMMQPKVIKQYITPIDNIANEFVER